jgi:hypothetical protein
MLNAWQSKGGAAITAKRLLGQEFFADDLPAVRVKDKAEWEQYKSELTRMARFHSKVVRQMKEGTREFKSVDKTQLIKQGMVKGAR